VAPRPLDDMLTGFLEFVGDAVHPADHRPGRIQ
jgi:hypothetical protein